MPTNHAPRPDAASPSPSSRLCAPVDGAPPSGLPGQEPLPLSVARALFACQLIVPVAAMRAACTAAWTVRRARFSMTILLLAAGPGTAEALAVANLQRSSWSGDARMNGLADTAHRFVLSGMLVHCCAPSRTGAISRRHAGNWPGHHGDGDSRSRAIACRPDCRPGDVALRGKLRLS